jgi:hypothetical protein
MIIECCLCRRKIGDKGSYSSRQKTAYDICPNCFRRFYPKEELLETELFCFNCGRECKHFIDEYRDRWEYICRNCGVATNFTKGTR